MLGKLKRRRRPRGESGYREDLLRKLLLFIAGQKSSDWN
jgi:hypothetical protein